MYQALLVDDERYALDGLQSGIDWSGLQVGEVHLASNIRQAKETMRSHPVDFLICDIEMPEGSGLELLIWVREHYPEKECVFLTCHGDFGYAKQAIQLGSHDYLLKPVRYSELETVIRKVLEKVEKRRQDESFKQSYDHYVTLWQQHQPLIVERFWLDLLNRELSSDPAEIVKALAQRNISYTEKMRFAPILISVQRWRRKLAVRDEKIMEYALRNAAAHSLIPGQDMGQVIPWRPGSLLAIWPCGDGGEEEAERLAWKARCQAFIDFCSQSMYCELSCYIGRASYLHEISALAARLSAFHANNVMEVNQAYFMEDELSRIEPEQDFKQEGIAFPAEWTELLTQGERERLLAEVRSFLVRIKTSDVCSPRTLHSFYHDFIQMIYYVLHAKGLKAHEIFSDLLSPEQAIMVTRSFSLLNEWAGHVIEVAIANLHEREESETIVDKVQLFIAANLDQPLTRKDIANHVYLNPDYLAKLFKKQTGTALSDYVVGERMKQAKSMLEHTGASIGAVALSVGYSSFSYFSKTFKSRFGMTPQEFRAELGD
ncbi:two-component system, response regulator YesN [Paenibacillus sp. UNCCL117]|uniref:response regulator n=1 Tax=unclassified Paenibacillus TaxID=185978 RepID=UPI00088D9050|nr:MULTISPECIES: response regulator [unclassified Paenibacillus]SDD02704.1 two-component system, response regulator YesN [Paenibacillus sp. cl123]SFW32442.1 two-component system, response regulator YesN [Paenibacillus sp. UNCCL117]